MAEYVEGHNTVRSKTELCILLFIQSLNGAKFRRWSSVQLNWRRLKLLDIFLMDLRGEFRDIDPDMPFYGNSWHR